MKAFTDMEHEEFERLIAPYVVKIIDDDNEAKFKYVIARNFKRESFTINELPERLSSVRPEPVLDFGDVKITVIMSSQTAKTKSGIPVDVRPAQGQVKRKVRPAPPSGYNLDGSLRKVRSDRNGGHAVITPLGRFECVPDAARAHNTSGASVRSLVKYHSNKENPPWRYV